MDQTALQNGTNEGGVALLTLRTATGGDLKTCNIKLFKASFTPTQASVAADFAAAEADFTGYLAAAVAAWSAVLFNAAGDPVVNANVLFTATAATPADSIGGFWIESSGTKVVQYAIFDQPITINAVGNFIALSLFVNGVNQSYADVQS